MKLIIKEYLTLLKESKELDSLLPELLLSMEHKVKSTAQIGVRQNGVDVLSTGIDEDGIKKVFLFTIKEGDLNRRDWHGNEQSVRPSLDDILETYIPNRLDKEASKLPKKVVLLTGGELKQEVQENWSGYTKKNSIEGEIEFAFWGGDELALLIEKHLFNEHIIPKHLRSKFRKTLALLSEVDYNLSDYYSFLEEILLDSGLEKKSQKEQLKYLRLIYLAINIIHTWSKDEDNLKHSLLASERTLLNITGYLTKHRLEKKAKLTTIYKKIFWKHFEIQNEYCQKLLAVVRSENGLAVYGGEFLQNSLTLFEQLGIFSLLGINFVMTQKNEDYLEESKAISGVIKVMINNHKGLFNPVYDEHITDISLAIFLLQSWNEIEFLDLWINKLIQHIDFAHRHLNKYFPIDSDNFEDLVSFNIANSLEKKDLMRMSTLIPILAQWCVKLRLIDNYKYLLSVIDNIYKDTTLQIWYPDKELKEHIYFKNAAYQCGYVDAGIKFPKNIDELSSDMDSVRESENFFSFQELEIDIFSSLLSSRHFRMPIIPQVWNINIDDLDLKE